MSQPTRSRVGAESDLRGLAAREACRDVVLTSFALADAGRRVDIAEFFINDGVQSIDGNAVRGRREIRAVLAARDAVPGRRTAHLLSEVDVDASTGYPDEVVVRGFIQLYLLNEEERISAEPNALAQVEDRLVPDSGVWRISKRSITTLVGRG